MEGRTLLSAVMLSLALESGGCGDEESEEAVLPDITEASGSGGCDNIRISEFTASPARIRPGEHTLLSWNGANARACDLEPGGFAFGGGPGLVEVRPQTTTTFTLECFATACLATPQEYARGRITVFVE